ncbi:MAG: hypothetical protein ABFS08_02990 [Pseudomonadota bacterium]
MASRKHMRVNMKVATTPPGLKLVHRFEPMNMKERGEWLRTAAILRFLHDIEMMQSRLFVGCYDQVAPLFGPDAESFHSYDLQFNCMQQPALHSLFKGLSPIQRGQWLAEAGSLYIRIEEVFNEAGGNFAQKFEFQQTGSALFTERLINMHSNEKQSDTVPSSPSTEHAQKKFAQVASPVSSHSIPLMEEEGHELTAESEEPQEYYGKIPAGIIPSWEEFIGQVDSKKG